jgi:cytidine deaminase
MALAAKKGGEVVQEPVTPCGMCRQVIAETQQRYQADIRILMTSAQKVLIANSISELLPHSFI